MYNKQKSKTDSTSQTPRSVSTTLTKSQTSQPSPKNPPSTNHYIREDQNSSAELKSVNN